MAWCITVYTLCYVQCTTSCRVRTVQWIGDVHNIMHCAPCTLCTVCSRLVVVVCTMLCTLHVHCALCSAQCTMRTVHSVQWIGGGGGHDGPSLDLRPVRSVTHPAIHSPTHRCSQCTVSTPECTVCRVAATVLTAGKMEWPQRELDCHLLLPLLLLLSAAYLLPTPTIYYLLDKSSCEERKKMMDSALHCSTSPQ